MNQITRDVAARQADILGKPPKIAPLPQDKARTQAHDAMVRLAEALGNPPPAPDAPIADFNATFAKNRALMEAHFALACHLFRGYLTVRDRELCILRVGWLCQAPFEYGEHVRIGKQKGKLTDEEVARAQVGSTAPGWSDHDRALLAAVEELMSDAKITDATWDVLTRTLNEAQLLELPILIGQYQGVAFMQNSVRVKLMPGNPGLTAR